MEKIKVVHTSDWHLGKRLYRKDREQEHRLFLDWLIQTLQERQVDVLLIAGDVFDSPTPPHSALKLYYDFLKRASDLGVHTFVISGNHDSQGLINAPKNLVKDRRVHLFPSLKPSLAENVQKVVVKGREIWVKGLPYFRNYELLKMALEIGEINEEEPREELFKKTLQNFFSYWPNNEKIEIEGAQPPHKILLGHHVFGEYAATGSEHFIGLTGIESIALSWFKDFADYAALGHIHQFQSLSKEQAAYYTGSPLQMRFSESKNKFIQQINFAADGKMALEKIQIPVFRELIQIKTNSANFGSAVQKRLDERQNLDSDLRPFVEVQVEMLETKTGMVDFIKEICDARGAELLSFLPILKEPSGLQEDSSSAANLDALELFRRFYQEKFPENKCPDYLEVCFKELLEEANDENS